MDDELKSFFETSKLDDIDTMFYNFIIKESQQPTPLRLINKYSSSLHPDIKTKLINYIISCLNENLDDTCGDPTVLIEYLTKHDDLHHKIIEVLEIISRNTECKSIFIHLIYYTCYIISKQKIKKDNLKYYDVLKYLCGIKANKIIFEDKKIWGLIDLPIDAGLVDKTNEFFFVIRNVDIINFNLKKNALKKHATEQNNHYNDVNEFFDIFKFRKQFVPYEAFKQNTLLPCFIEGALAPFFYDRERVCEILLNKSSSDLRNSMDIFIEDIKFIQKSLHLLLYDLIRSNEKIRNNFLAFLQRIYSANEERRKMMYERKNYITDGVVFNLCNVLDAFCDKIVEKKIVNKIDFDFLNQSLPTEEDNTKNKSKQNVVGHNYNSFCTKILTYRILFTELSYIRMYEEKRVIMDQIDDFEDEQIKAALESNLNAFRIIFFSDFFLQQDTFLEYMIDCIVYKEKLDVKDAPLFFNPLFYRILVDFKHHNMICRYGTLSNNLYLIMQKMLFSNINIHEKEKILRIMYEEKWDITKELFFELCETYSKAGKLSLLDRFTIRGYINLIIQNDHNKYIRLLEKNGINFISGVIQDLEKLLSTGVDAIVNIKKLNNKIIELDIQKIDKENEEYKETVEKLSYYSKQAKGSFSHIDKAFEILRYILRNNKILFTYNEVKFLLVNTLNYNLKVLVGPKCSSLSVENMKKYNFEPRVILGLLCTIYSEIRTVDLREAILNGKDFNLHFFKRALKIVKERAIMKQDEMQRFEAFVQRIEMMSEKNVEKEEKVYPDEFLDPLTFEVMRNPVKLLTSNVTVDKSTFDLIMVSDGVDPFCREPLDETKYINNAELKKKIDEFENQ